MTGFKIALPLTVAMSVAALPTGADAAALWVDVFTPRIAFPGCSRSFESVMRRMGMTDIKGDQLGVGGSIGTGRVSVICARTRNSGVCNNGVTAVISVAMDSVEEAQKTKDNLRRAFGNPVMIDCG
jgi:hypothetical protein